VCQGVVQKAVADTMIFMRGKSIRCLCWLDIPRLGLSASPLEMFLAFKADMAQC